MNLRHIIVPSVLFLSACGGNLHETVSVRVDNVSCTERIYSPRQGSISGDINKNYDSNPISGSFSVNIPMPGNEENAPEQRCSEILSSAAAISRINEKLKYAELKKVENENILQDLKIHREKLKIENEENDLENEW